MSDREDEIRQRLKAATPGPWIVSEDGGWNSAGAPCTWVEASKVPEGAAADEPPGVCTVHTDTKRGGLPCAWADAALIAHGPSDLAYLLEALEVARTDAALALAERDTFRKRCAALMDQLAASVMERGMERAAGFEVERTRDEARGRLAKAVEALRAIEGGHVCARLDKGADHRDEARAALREIEGGDQ